VAATKYDRLVVWQGSQFFGDQTGSRHLQVSLVGLPSMSNGIARDDRGTRVGDRKLDLIMYYSARAHFIRLGPHERDDSPKATDYPLMT
jgi:hypothetical protein